MQADFTSLFFCSICGEEHNLAAAVAFDNCCCLFCRPCVTTYLSSQLNETSRSRKFTVFAETYCSGRVGLYVDDEGANKRATVVDIRFEHEWDDAIVIILLDSGDIVEAPYWRVSFEGINHVSGESFDTFWACPCPGEMCDGLITMTEAKLLCSEAWTAMQESNTFINAKKNGCIQCPYPDCRCLIERLSSEQSHQALEGADHGKHHRFRCAGCQKDFCGICFARPYHAGYNCKQFKMPNCLYCDEKLDPSHPSNKELMNIEEFNPRRMKTILNELGVDFSWCVERGDLIFVLQRVQTVCHREQCRKLLKGACTKKLPCGHGCCGTRTARHYLHRCLPCFEPDCPHSSSEFDGCQICWESFTKSPCISLSCGHLIHLECARERIVQGYPGPSIGFNHLYCSMCGTAARQGGSAQIAMSNVTLNHALLQKEIAPILKLRELTVKLALTRLNASDDANAEELKPGGEYHGRPADFALKKYLFYFCSKCKMPYYGGNRECQAAAENAAEFDAKDLICGSCCAQEAGQNCPRHGTRYIEWKCRYCCEVAVWFCHGHTHYCDACHRTLTRQCKPCRGADCPLKVQHPGPGTEFCLGCALCRHRFE